MKRNLGRLRSLGVGSGYEAGGGGPGPCLSPYLERDLGDTLKSAHPEAETLIWLLSFKCVCLHICNSPTLPRFLILFSFELEDPKFHKITQKRSVWLADAVTMAGTSSS